MNSGVRVSPTLSAKELSLNSRQMPATGFGEVVFPILECLGSTQSCMVSAGAYSPVCGSTEARKAVARYFEQRTCGVPGIDEVLLGPGSKILIHDLLRAIAGDVVVFTPAWPTYMDQARLLGRRVIAVETCLADGYQPDPERLRWAIRKARRDGMDPGIVLVNSPNNPTGAVYSEEILRDLCAVARAERQFLISDEVYAELTFDPNGRKSPYFFYPEGTAVTSSLSKWLGIGGWRVGFALLPRGNAGRELSSVMKAFAAATWTSCPVPCQKLAVELLSNRTVRNSIQALMRRIHQYSVSSLRAFLLEHGALVSDPGGAFYLYPNFSPFAAALRNRFNVQTGEDLQQLLYARFGLPVLGGHHFGDENPYAVRISTGCCFRLERSQLRKLLFARSAVQTRTLPSLDQEGLNRTCRSLGDFFASLQG